LLYRINDDNFPKQHQPTDPCGGRALFCLSLEVILYRPAIQISRVVQGINAMAVTGVSGAAAAVAVDDSVVSAAVMRGTVTRTATARSSGAPSKQDCNDTSHEFTAIQIGSHCTVKEDDNLLGYSAV
jgi:hypothetical protein